MSYEIVLSRDTNGNPVELREIDPRWEEWDGNDATNAPLNLSGNTIGFDGGGLGNMYQYSRRLNTWTATGATWSDFQGV